MKTFSNFAFLLVLFYFIPLNVDGKTLPKTKDVKVGTIEQGNETNSAQNNLIPTPRLCATVAEKNEWLTDIQNILTTLTGGNLTGGLGTVVFIILAVATFIFWIIIFFIVYYAVLGKKEKEGGGYDSGGYSSPNPSYGYGRSLIPHGFLNSITDMAWKALDRLTVEYEKNEVEKLQ